MAIKIISAGAGSGKTYRLTEEMVAFLEKGVRPEGIIATTFTQKAAAELQARVRIKLLQKGYQEEADLLSNALIGTVHSLGVKLLKRFAFEAGVSPKVDIIADGDQQILFNKSLATVLSEERIQRMEQLCDRLGLNKRDRHDWRKEVKRITDTARSNDFTTDELLISKEKSFQSFQKFLPNPSDQSAISWNDQLELLLTETLGRLKNNEDQTKVTQSGQNELRNLLNDLQNRGSLHWYQWVKILRLKVGAKSRADIKELVEFAKTHDAHPDFQQDIKAFIDTLFDISIDALEEYDAFKKNRGLIDYIDMETQVNRLLDHPFVREVLSQEMDLLMVDEFQDTNPIQLSIFYKLANLANESVWVGDPKQSIYGFRGADPALMQQIIEYHGGVKPENVQEYSWRSREDLVYLVNALFSKVFTGMTPEQIVLKPQRTKKKSRIQPDEPPELDLAVRHWHFNFSGEGRQPGKSWLNQCIAHQVKAFLDDPPIYYPKEGGDFQRVKPGDIAILCLRNSDCQDMADALYEVGLKAAIARQGLLQTPEIKLILACLKLLLNAEDSLSIAEIMKLAEGKSLEHIINDRLKHLKETDGSSYSDNWGATNNFISSILDLQPRVSNLSSSEILQVLLEELDIRRRVLAFGNPNQRLDNIDALSKLVYQYEDACNRLHTAASLGGFLIWLSELEEQGEDDQGVGAGEDTINVMTYHKSKGLEWPVVICTSMESSLRDSVFGLAIESEQAAFNPENILGNRWIRYWVNPYHTDMLRHTPLQARLSESAIQQRVTRRVIEENARVLYVGMTRARDYLIFPTREKPTSWLNRTWNEGNEDVPTLDPKDTETPWSWEGKVLLKNNTIKDFSRDFPEYGPPKEHIEYYDSHATKEFFPNYYINLREEDFSNRIKGLKGNQFSYSAVVELKKLEDPYQFSKAIKSFFVADHLEHTLEKREKMLKFLLERYQVMDEEVLKMGLQQSANFQQFVREKFGKVEEKRKFPVSGLFEGRLFETVIDNLRFTEWGIAVIQHSGYAGSQQKIAQKVKELSSWAYFVKATLVQLYDGKRVRVFIHFVLHGSLVELQIVETLPFS